jgi:hypothetical protein
MNKVIFNMTSGTFLGVVSLTIISFLLLLSGEELFAQQRGTISVERAVALPLTTAEGNQLRIIMNYELEDESLIGQRINAIMGIYDRQTGSLIKLSSFPNGFILNNTNGTTQLATTLTDDILQNISAIVTLTNVDKSEKYTNDVRTDLDLRTILPTTLPPLLENIPTSEPEVGAEEDDSSSVSNGPDSEEE